MMEDTNHFVFLFTLPKPTKFYFLICPELQTPDNWGMNCLPYPELQTQDNTCFDFLGTLPAAGSEVYIRVLKILLPWIKLIPDILFLSEVANSGLLGKSENHKYFLCID